MSLRKKRSKKGDPNLGALLNKIGFGGILCHSYEKDPPPKKKEVVV